MATPRGKGRGGGGGGGGQAFALNAPSWIRWQLSKILPPLYLLGTAHVFSERIKFGKKFLVLCF